MKRSVVGAALVGMVALGGCGGSDTTATTEQKPSASSEQRAILATIDELQAASRRGDAQTICDRLFTRGLAASITAAAQRNCPAAVKQRFVSRDAQISVSRQLTVKGSRATAVIREQNGRTSRVLLVKERGRWRIAAVRPTRAQ